MKNSTIIDIFTSRSVKHLSMMLSGNIFAAIFGFLTILLISRELSVSDFGLFNLTISYMVILARFSAFGTEIPLIKYCSSYLAAGKNEEAGQVVVTSLYIRTAVSLTIAFFSFNSAGLLSIRLFNYPELVPLVKLSSFGIITISMFSFLRAVFHAYQEFRKSVMLQLLTDLGKFSGALIMIFMLDVFNLFNAIGVFVIIPLLGIVPGFVVVNRLPFAFKGPTRILLNQILTYSKWRFISSLCGTVLQYVGVFMLGMMSNSEAVGVYGLAVNLTLIFPIVTYSLVTVLLPKASRFRDVVQFSNYINISLKISIYAGISVMPLLLVSSKLIPFFFGIKYIDSIPVFNWLLIGAVLQVINTTVHVALFSMNKPGIVALADVLSLIGMIGGCYYLIPSYGTIAPAITLVALNGIRTLVIYVYTSRFIREGNIEFEEDLTLPT